MTVLGMDIEQVQSLANSMQQNSEQIQTITQQLTSLIDTTSWTGQDNQQFRTDWDGTYSVQLRNVVNALQDRYTHLRSEIDQQNQASGN